MRKRLLFVDDDPMLLQGLRRTLHDMREEWDLQFANSGPEALETLEREQFDAIITDMRMPGMDGAQLLELTKQRHPELIRIVLSGASSRDAVLRSIAPAHQYISKPCEIDDLKHRLGRAFAMRDLLSDPSVKSIVSGLKSIPSLPAIYEEMMQALRSETASIAEVGKIVSKDSGMTAKILQLANSAYVGLRAHVTHPAQAISLLGVGTVRTLVLSVNVFSQFERQSAVAPYIPSLWKHTLEVANLAQRIAVAEHASKEVTEESFTAGLLHDVGRLILLAEMRTQYLQILKRQKEERIGRLDLEMEILGCTHAQVGAYLIGIWGLPEGLVHAVAFHHQPAIVGDSAFSPLLAVHSADMLVTAEDTASINCDIEVDDHQLAELGFSEKLAEWHALLEQAKSAPL